LNNSVILRSFFAPHVDFAPSVSRQYASRRVITSSSQAPTSIDADGHIFDASLLPSKVIADLPAGYSMRPLTQADYERGFLEVLRASGKVGYVNSARWHERCEWLRKKAVEREEYVLVIVEDKPNRVVGVGTWRAEKGL
jgi:glucosamine-phosphate N-acetyltransferase